ncbi:MAG: acetylserotonin O-methyltransferase [Deltaproteobacteria bacterium]|nr:acetylserotonin O-methyltransferase [Deltaproteobacteria bacterium]
MTLDQEGGFHQLMEMGRGFQAAKMLTVAVDLAVFDFLEEPHSAVEAAAWLKANDRAVGIFLNGLAALGLLTKGVDYFQNSKIASRFLVQSKDDYRGAILKHMGHTFERGWNDLQNTILVGHFEGVEPETWVDTRPKRDEESMRAFILGMHALARDLAPQVAPKLNLQGVRHLLDLGGGPATYAITFAQANPGLNATVFDLPGPIEIARENIAKAGLDARIDTRAGNFLQDDIGSGYDFIWISHILHSHNEEQSLLIIRKAVAALVAGGRLAIQDFYLNPDGYTPPVAAMFGVHMLAVTPRGRAYTYGEVAQWLKEAELTAPEHIQSSPEASILMGKKK